MSGADYYDWDGERAGEDSYEQDVREKLIELFERNRKKVFFSRQLEVRLEDDYFHWITNRAIRALIADGLVKEETRPLRSAGEIHLLWHPSFRYYKREAAKLVKLVEEYSHPNIAGAIGLHGESMVLEGFARHEFVMKGRNTQSYGCKDWTKSGHNLDFIFVRDDIAYGVEVKNTLGYMEQEELRTKIEMCRWLDIRPVFVARMLPRTWINEVIQSGGFALILKYQLYPWTHKDIATRVSKSLGLPVDAPKALAEGTMRRFLRWHESM
jgi:hypothetical protein